MSTRAPADNDGVVVFPPAVFLAGLVLGYALGWFWPVRIVPAEWSLALRIAGTLIAAWGLAVIIAAGWLFTRAGTTPTHWEPTTTIVAAGPYRYSRNPMYVGMAAIQGGGALLGNLLWPLLLLPVAVWIIQTQVIAREERYLETKFGRAYLDYKARVRRWV